MNENDWEMPAINWFGGYLVTRHLLEWTKSGIETGDKDSFIAKMNRLNFIARVMATTQILNSQGPTIEAAQTLQQMGWFTGVSAESVMLKMKESIEILGSNGIWKFHEGEFGSLDFSKVESDSDGFDGLLGEN